MYRKLYLHRFLGSSNRHISLFGGRFSYRWRCPTTRLAIATRSAGRTTTNARTRTDNSGKIVMSVRYLGNINNAILGQAAVGVTSLLAALCCIGHIDSLRRSILYAEFPLPDTLHVVENTLWAVLFATFLVMNTHHSRPGVLAGVFSLPAAHYIKRRPRGEALGAALVAYDDHHSRPGVLGEELSLPAALNAKRRLP